MTTTTCGCGCGQTTSQSTEFVRGHGARLRRSLQQLAAQGDVQAYNELAKRNWMRIRNFGVEMEVLIPSSVSCEQVCIAMERVGIDMEKESYNHNTRKHWKMVTDSSVSSHKVGYYGMEIVSPVLSGNDGIDQVKKVSQVLLSLGVQVNKSCGLHVHISAKALSQEHIANILTNYAACEQSIDAGLTNSRRNDNNTYCRSLRNRMQRTTAWDLVRQMNNGGYDRYHKVNLAAYLRHGTIKFRQHQGTVEAEKIEQWIHLLQCLIVRSRSNSWATDGEDICSFLNLSDSRKAYWTSRRTKLAA
jgi:hypothetical protein